MALWWSQVGKVPVSSACILLTQSCTNSVLRYGPTWISSEAPLSSILFFTIYSITCIRLNVSVQLPPSGLTCSFAEIIRVGPSPYPQTEFIFFILSDDRFLKRETLGYRFLLSMCLCQRVVQYHIVGYVLSNKMFHVGYLSTCTLLSAPQTARFLYSVDLLPHVLALLCSHVEDLISYYM